MKSILFFLVIFLSSSLNAQIEIETDQGDFEHLLPWGEGFLGVVQTQKLILMPKSREFQYFDKGGELVWKHNLDPYNFNNQSLCHGDSEYAYFVNMPFSKTAVAERTDNSICLNLYQLDQEGNLKEKQLTFKDISAVLAEDSKDFSSEFLGAYKDGLVLVGSTSSSSSYVIKIDHDFNVSFTRLVYDWDSEQWKDKKLSKMKFALGENQFSIINMKLSSYELITNIKTIDLNSSELSKVTNTLNVRNYSLSNLNSMVDIDYSMKQMVYSWYSKQVGNGETEKSVSTLGGFVEFEYFNGELKMLAHYENKVFSSLNKREKEGYLVFNLNHKEDASVEVSEDFVFDNEYSRPLNHRFHIDNDGHAFFITQHKRKVFAVRSSVEEVGSCKKCSYEQVLLSVMKGKSLEEFEDIDAIYFAKDQIFGFDFVGRENAFGYTSKAIIYPL